MTFRVLFCCRANVCRSPAAVALFRATLGSDLVKAVSVEAAGVQPSHVTAMCEEALAWITRQSPDGIDVESHRPTPVTANRVSRADLVIAMDSEVRAQVLRTTVGQNRGLQDRLFTLVEAAALAGAVRSSLPGGEGGKAVLRVEPLPADVGDRLTWLVTEMNAARGLVRIPRQRRWRGSDPLEVHDAHDNSNGVRHKTMLPVLTDSVKSLSDAVRGVVGVEGGSDGRHRGHGRAGQGGQGSRRGRNGGNSPVTGVRR